MMMNMNVGSSARVETFAFPEEMVNVTVVPHTISQPMQIARYFTEDLKAFLRQTNIDLIHYLHIEDEPEYPQDIEEVINLLYDDIRHMIGDGLVSAINLLISEDQPDPNLYGAYLMRYHATYLIAEPVRPLRSEAAQRFGGYLAPPSSVWRDEHYRFDLLIDWNRTANEERRKRVVRPTYNFDWVAEKAHFDRSSLIRYRSGGMTMDGAVIVSREEAAMVGHLGR